MALGNALEWHASGMRCVVAIAAAVCRLRTRIAHGAHARSFNTHSSRWRHRAPAAHANTALAACGMCSPSPPPNAHRTHAHTPAHAQAAEGPIIVTQPKVLLPAKYCESIYKTARRPTRTIHVRRARFLLFERACALAGRCGHHRCLCQACFSCGHGLGVRAAAVKARNSRADIIMHD